MQKSINRLFLAVPAILFDYEKLQSDFSGLISGRWTPSVNLHLTLCFFGDRFEQEDLTDRLDPLLRNTDASKITGLGFFEHNHILYAKTVNPALNEMYESIVREFGLPKKRGFVGHITLMRIKKIHEGEMFRQKLHDYENMTIGTLNPQLQLMQSRLYSDGAQYELIKRFEI